MKVKTLSVFLVILPLLVIGLIPVQAQGTPTQEDSIVSIPDANLASRIRSALGLSADAPITKTAMLELTTLTVTFLEISNLTGLEYATNLQALYISDNQVSDLSPLKGLTKLESLLLSGNQISDFSHLFVLGLVPVQASRYTPTDQKILLISAIPKRIAESCSGSYSQCVAISSARCSLSLKAGLSRPKNVACYLPIRSVI